MCFFPVDIRTCNQAAGIYIQLRTSNGSNLSVCNIAEPSQTRRRTHHEHKMLGTTGTNATMVQPCRTMKMPFAPLIFTFAIFPFHVLMMKILAKNSLCSTASQHPVLTMFSRWDSNIPGHCNWCCSCRFSYYRRRNCLPVYKRNYDIRNQFHIICNLCGNNFPVRRKIRCVCS